MNRGRLLIFDDDSAVGATIHMIALTAGFEAQVVSDPVEFFRAVDSWLPTHIGLDLIMPQMDGVQVLMRLAQRRCTAQIIITSGVGGRVLSAAERAASESGLNICGILAKPFPPDALRRLLLAGPAADGVRRAPSPAARLPDSPAEALQEMQRGLAEREFEAVYQPQVDCLDGRLVGFEVLARWAHKQRGLIMPGIFIPFAEAHGLIDPLTEQLLDKSLRWFAANFPESPAPRDERTRNGHRPSLSVNISTQTLSDTDFVDNLSARCDAAGITPANLIFELTETAAMRDPISALALLTRARMKGFQLSIDDFGTGFSSMLQLVRLPFSEIKIDQSFVMTALRSSESRAVVKSVVDLGHSLGLRAVAEGVENADTLSYLQSLRCDVVQGWHISHPMSGEQTRHWLSQRGEPGESGGPARPA